MKEISNNCHVILAEQKLVKENGLKYTVEVQDLLLDAKYLMCDYYVATICQKGNVLRIAFNNGQIFKLSIEEVF